MENTSSHHILCLALFHPVDSYFCSCFALSSFQPSPCPSLLCSAEVFYPCDMTHMTHLCIILTSYPTHGSYSHHVVLMSVSLGPHACHSEVLLNSGRMQYFSVIMHYTEFAATPIFSSIVSKEVHLLCPMGPLAPVPHATCSPGMLTSGPSFTHVMLRLTSMSDQYL